MKIQDAKPGDVLYDGDGDPWERHEDGATVTCVSGDGGPVVWREDEMTDADEDFGPFTAKPHPSPPKHT